MCMQILDSGEEIGLKHFKPIKPLGSGDTGRYVFYSTYYVITVTNVLICHLSSVPHALHLDEVLYLQYIMMLPY